MSPILSGDLHFAARPRVSLNVTVDGGEERKKRKKKRVTGFRKRGGGFYLARLSETRRRGEKMGGEKSIRFVFILYRERDNREREREKFRN